MMSDFATKEATDAVSECVRESERQRENVNLLFKELRLTMLSTKNEEEHDLRSSCINANAMNERTTNNTFS